MITYNCTLRMLYKNALLLALGKLPLNVLLSIISFVILFYVCSFEPTIAILLTFIIFYAIVRFPLEFYAARTISRVVNSAPKGEDE